MVFPFTTLRQFRTLDLAPCPAIQAYLARIAARPAHRRAMDRARPGPKAG